MKDTDLRYAQLLKDYSEQQRNRDIAYFIIYMLLMLNSDLVFTKLICILGILAQFMGNYYAIQAHYKCCENPDADFSSESKILTILEKVDIFLVITVLLSFALGGLF